MFYRTVMVSFMIGVVCVCMSSRAMAEMVGSEKDVSVRKLGVAWNIAEDRKMENISGIYEPEGLDKYMKRYFEQLSSKVDQLIEQNNRLEKKVDELLSKSGQSSASQSQRNS